MIENKNEREEWNDRWLMQLIVWKAELAERLDEVMTLVALIDLAMSQIKQDPPE